MKRPIALIGSLFVLTGCATVTNGMQEGVRVVSEPAGATVTTNLKSKAAGNVNGYLGCEPAPCSISVPRKESPIITIALDGYQPIRFKVTSAVATSATSVPTGSLVAGLPPGSHVVAGEPDLMKRLPTGVRVLTSGVATLGMAAVVDVGSGANRNLSPNPVTAYLAPLEISDVD